MNFLKISSLIALALVTGCAASASDDPSEASQDELASRPRIELPTTRDEASVQSKLFNLMETFKGQDDLDIQGAIESASLTMSGAGEVGVRGRAITCNADSLEAVAPGGGGFTRITMYNCVFQGFDKVRNGGKLPSVVVPFDGNKPLAGKLLSLLAQGEKKGGLGVKRIGGTEHPPCCDMPTSVTYAIADDSSTLSCTMRGGGFTGIEHAECTFSKNDTH